MRKAIAKDQTLDEGTLEGGIEWIVARELAPVQEELARLRIKLDALREMLQPW